MACQSTKLAFFADLHCHNFGEFAKTLVIKDKPINSRLYDLLRTLRRSFRAARKRGCTHLIILGDVFHIRGQIPTDVLQYVYDLFLWAKTHLKMEIIMSDKLLVALHPSPSRRA